MRYASRRKRNKFIPFLLAGLVIMGLLIWFKREQANAPQSANGTNVSEQAQEEDKQQSLPVIDLQPVVNAWADKQSGTASVVIIDLANNKVIAELNPDRIYFTASIYKLYVAYEGYQKVANGTHKLTDPYITGYTRGKCLDAMIRDSYSPCAEKMWVELGKEKLTEKLKAYGLTNTSMVGLRTSAHDAAIILQRLHERKELTEEHTNLFLDSMKTQDPKYRRGLPSGFANSTVYNKVGWNEQIEWHDTAIVTLPNGRSYVVSVLTQNVGTTQIKELAKAIEAELNK